MDTESRFDLPDSSAKTGENVALEKISLWSFSPVLPTLKTTIDLQVSQPASRAPPLVQAFLAALGTVVRCLLANEYRACCRQAVSWLLVLSLNSASATSNHHCIVGPHRLIPDFSIFPLESDFQPRPAVEDRRSGVLLIRLSTVLPESSCLWRLSRPLSLALYRQLCSLLISPPSSCIVEKPMIGDRKTEGEGRRQEER